jgi:hypothetical protein
MAAAQVDGCVREWQECSVQIRISQPLPGHQMNSSQSESLSLFASPTPYT